MEQTNLVVTSDGKTWDEVTRDTSYIGHRIYANVQAGPSGTTSGISVFKTQRGGASTSYNQDKAMKGIVIGYDRFIVLEDGLYTIVNGTYSGAANVDCYLKLNSAASGAAGNIFMARIDMPDDTKIGSHTLSLKRNDYITFYSNVNVHKAQTFITITKD